MRGLLKVGGALALVWTLGLLVFIAQIPRTVDGPARPAPAAVDVPFPKADAIVVLTGGQNRLQAGVDLLSQRQGARLLITGVHVDTSREVLRRQVGDAAGRFDCCVDLDHKALSTWGNAQETALWAERNGYRSLIVVTAHYHMPRSLLEFRRAMPDMDLIPHPVFPGGVEMESWWNHAATGRLVIAEYTKFLAALVGLSV